MKSLQNTLKTLPSNPGVYLFKNKADRILYIGKAKNLKKRVFSYFQKNNVFSLKEKMLPQVNKIDYLITGSEDKALILESKLIKKYQPKYNTAFKDDKRYQYIKIDYSDDFPKILTARKIKKDKSRTFLRSIQPRRKDLFDTHLSLKPATKYSGEVRDRARYFGPFPNSKAIKQVLNLLNHLFHFRECRQKMLTSSIVLKNYKLCLRYYIGRCEAPCIKKISKEKYAQIIKKCELFLEGRKKEILENLKQEMQQKSQEQKFEEATKLRDQILNLQKIISQSKFNLLHDRVKDGIEQKDILELSKILNLKKVPKRIECFDISNIQGKFATGSMVVFKNGLPQKSEYRRFKIKMKGIINDIAMMKEMLLRRFAHLISKPRTHNLTVEALDNSLRTCWTNPRSDRQGMTVRGKKSLWPLPNLIIIDGGRGQLNAALDVLKKYHLNIPAISLAKKNEEIYLPPYRKVWRGSVSEKLKSLSLPQNSQALFLLQNLRDEAHRFAHDYHKKLRKNGMLLT